MHILPGTENVQVFSIKVLFSEKYFQMIKYSLNIRDKGNFPDQLPPSPLIDEKPEVPFNSIYTDH